jgi:GMP synthase-like glutamine amidotransferase
MKPVAIFRFLQIEEPGYFATFLDNKHIPWQLIRIDAGETPPANIDQFSSLVFMGGSMSVNDDLPWIMQTLALIQKAVARDIPVLGHCLGGQLLAKALGGEIGSNPVKEIGWGEVSVADHPVAREWFNHLSGFESFHWHGETFSLPDGVIRLLSSRYCENQVFAKSIHLGMQCHVEMTEDMVKTWCEVNRTEISREVCPSVQSREDMLMNLATRVSALNRVADFLYTKWISGLKCR